jgi:hypothetical protein
MKRALLHLGLQHVAAKSRVLIIEKFIVAELVIFLAFYRNRPSITVFKRASHWSFRSWPRERNIS